MSVSVHVGVVCPRDWVWVHVCGYTCRGRGWCQVSFSINFYLAFESGLSLSQELGTCPSVWPDSPRSLWSLPPQRWEYRCLTSVCENPALSSSLQGPPWAILPAPCNFLLEQSVGVIRTAWLPWLLDEWWKSKNTVCICCNSHLWLKVPDSSMSTEVIACSVPEPAWDSVTQRDSNILLPF